MHVGDGGGVLADGNLFLVAGSVLGNFRLPAQLDCGAHVALFRIHRSRCSHAAPARVRPVRPSRGEGRELMFWTGMLSF